MRRVERAVVFLTLAASLPRFQRSICALTGATALRASPPPSLATTRKRGHSTSDTPASRAQQRQRRFVVRTHISGFDILLLPVHVHPTFTRYTRGRQVTTKSILLRFLYKAAWKRLCPREPDLNTEYLSNFDVATPPTFLSLASSIINIDQHQRHPQTIFLRKIKQFIPQL